MAWGGLRGKRQAGRRAGGSKDRRSPLVLCWGLEGKCHVQAKDAAAFVQPFWSHLWAQGRPQQATVPTRTQTRATPWRILPKTRRRGPRGGRGARLPQWPAGQPNGGGVEMGREVGPVPPMCGGSLALRRQTARTQIPSNAGSNPPRHPYSATHQKKGAYSTAVFSNTVSQLCRTGKPGGRFQPHCYTTQPSTQANCYTQLHYPPTHGGCCALT